MISWIAKRIVNVFENNEVMEHEKEIYQHGLELWLSYVSGLIVQIIFCIFSGFWIETILFILFLETLRKYAGGYHANTYLGCNIIYLLSYFIYYALMVYVEILPSISVIGYLLSALIVLRLSPVTHIHNPLTKEEQNKYRQISYLIVFMDSVLFFVFYFLLPYYMNIIFISMLMNALFMLVGLLFNERGGI
ncbi:accessory gene regulator B [Breznakia sp. PF5-3]|uniref:accessory gene regulator B family protein n=1 Tax=unclassified Breznakia TaxID=2623764 RepID=UPI002406BBE9|nr:MULTISPECIES: accessory gene regulator B family protein [unclassified Breznakia]MDF9825609.1 accessory gene regulator B [Breznakia sp. PM6-1]MDF9836448.1 accessory gene regulator B [Breznakia sp. PF5-3]MDF9838350.1 accessory gene regulator B [Breznakia sp. PFB2-8]MDF9860358.1 accessory gene regulator B [Breznakia sp. PH5-24]